METPEPLMKPAPETPVHSENHARTNVSFLAADQSLRFLLFATTLTAVLVMVTGNQTKVYPVLGAKPAKWRYSPAFVYFVAALSVACLYSIISILMSLLASRRPNGLNKLLLHCIVIDVIMVGIVASATGTAGAVAYLGLKGNSHVQWGEICSTYGKFCRHIGSSAALSLVASIILVLLVMLSAYTLYRRSS